MAIFKVMRPIKDLVSKARFLRPVLMFICKAFTTRYVSIGEDMNEYLCGGRAVNGRELANRLRIKKKYCYKKHGSKSIQMYSMYKPYF